MTPNIIEEIKREKRLFDWETGGPSKYDKESLFWWMGRVNKHVYSLTPLRAQKTFRQALFRIAAVCITAVEAFDRNRPLHVYQNVTDHYIANSKEHAAELWREESLRNLGKDEVAMLEDEGANIFSQVPDEMELKVSSDHGSITKTAKTWTESEPTGFLCSTEF